MWKTCCASLALLLLLGTQAQAHFGTVIPSTPTVMDKKDANGARQAMQAHIADIERHIFSE